MKLLHVAPIDGRLGSGLSYSIPALMNAQQTEGVEVQLLASYLNPENISNVDCPIIWKKDLGRAGYHRLGELLRWSDLIIFHSTYIPFHWRVARLARRLRVPMIITPRGGMSVCADSIKRHKKFLANYLFFNYIVYSCSAVHYLTEQEAAASSRWERPSFVVPNGIAEVEFGRNAKSTGGPINLVFIGRIAINHKGLDLLLSAIEALISKPEVPNFVLNIYGPGVPSDLRSLDKLIKSKLLQSHVKVNPPVYGEDKSHILRAADVFVLTSRFEGHPMAILEALSYGVPCLVSVGTNMASEVEAAKAGWVCNSDVISITETLLETLRQHNDYDIRGRAAQQLARSYSWGSIARQTLAEYKKIISANDNLFL